MKTEKIKRSAASGYEILANESGSGTERAIDLLTVLFKNFRSDIRVRLWDGSELAVGNRCRAPTIYFKYPQVFASMLLSRNPLQLADSYFRGNIDIEGDIYEVLKIRHYFATLELAIDQKIRLISAALSLKFTSLFDATPASRLIGKRPKYVRMPGSSKKFNKSAIAFHYDVSNDFYRLWLDENMVYSCAYYEDVCHSLEHAQTNKLMHICRKLRLRPGDTLLDIGCGWGALACMAAEKYGSIVVGITLSQQQYDYATRLVLEKGLEHKVSIKFQDYRDLNGEVLFDKVVSVGMFEHVGLKNLDRYFEVVNRQLKPGGLFLNHGITMDEGGWKTSIGTQFINKYVFPDGQLDTVSNVQRKMEDGGFEIHDVECLRVHYALTLREWVRRLQEKHEEALNYVDEATYRVWQLYMAGCAQQFEVGGVGIYQILVSKRNSSFYPLPLTRQDIYN